MKFSIAYVKFLHEKKETLRKSDKLNKVPKIVRPKADIFRHAIAICAFIRHHKGHHKLSPE